MYWILRTIASFTRAELKPWIDGLSQASTQAVAVVVAEAVMCYPNHIYFTYFLGFRHDFSVLPRLLNYPVKNKINWLLCWCRVKNLPLKYAASPQLVSSEDTWEVDVFYIHIYTLWFPVEKIWGRGFSAANPKYCSEFTSKPWATPKSPESQCCHFC